MDDMAYPSYSSAKIKSRHMTFGEGESSCNCFYALLTPSSG